MLSFYEFFEKILGNNEIRKYRAMSVTFYLKNSRGHFFVVLGVSLCTNFVY